MASLALAVQNATAELEIRGMPEPRQGAGVSVQGKPLDGKPEPTLFRCFPERQGVNRDYGGSRDRYLEASGFVGSKYIYGEIVRVGETRIEGYLFRQGRAPIYVYGGIDCRTGIVSAYDAQGNYYSLSLAEGSR
jgi:hypothetical protein